MKEIIFNELRDRVHNIAVSHGWHDEEQPIEHWLCLIIGELSEAIEADRKGRMANIAAFDKAMKEPVSPHEAASPEEIYKYWFEAYIKDSVDDELADTVIRILDLAGIMQQDLSGVNVNTAFRHFVGCKELPLTTRIFRLQSWVVKLYYAKTKGFYMYKILIEALFQMAGHLNIDLLKSIELKMKYNEYRPYKHGKKY